MVGWVTAPWAKNLSDSDMKPAEVAWCRLQRKGFGLSCRSGCLIHNGTCIRVSRVRITLTVTVRVSRVSVMVSVRDSVK